MGMRLWESSYRSDPSLSRPSARNTIQLYGLYVKTAITRPAPEGKKVLGGIPIAERRANRRWGT
jgi:hypothetical protein